MATDGGNECKITGATAEGGGRLEMRGHVRMWMSKFM